LTLKSERHTLLKGSQTMNKVWFNTNTHQPYSHCL